MSVLVLASASPRRRELLARVGVVFEVVPADLDESELPGEDPAAYVARIARAKVDAVAAGREDRWVLAADTTVTIDGAILAKAADASEAHDMLRRLSGRVHQVMTGFVLRGPGGTREGVVTSDVVMDELTDAVRADYVDCGDWRGKAGAYALQGIGAALVREVRGSVTNVIGLPLVEVLAALRETGAPGPRFTAGVVE